MSEERGDGEGVGSQTLSDTLRYINLPGLFIDLVPFRGPIHLHECVRKEGGDGEGVDSESISDTFRYIDLAGLVTGLVALRGPMHLFIVVYYETIKRELELPSEKSLIEFTSPPPIYCCLL